MYTQCHRCLTVYKLQAEALARTRGNFRCGHCGHVFDGLERLIERLPDGPFQELPQEEVSETPVVLSVPAMRPQRQPALFDAENASNPGARREPRLPGEWIALDSGVRVEPDLRRGGSRNPVASHAAHTPARNPAAGAAGGGVRWWLGSALLALTLGGQIAYAERERLLEDARVRPWLDRACETLRCQLPMRTAVAAIRLVSREVRPHPDAPHALMISASMVNDAGFAQRFPVVEVLLSDLSERPIAMRRFRPAEYLADPENIGRGFPAGATAPLVFEVADPGQEAVAFEFRFVPAPEVP